MPERIEVNQIRNGQVWIGENLNPCASIRDKIAKEIVNNPPIALNKGVVIANGVNEELDELRRISTSGKDYLLHEGDVILFNENVIHEIVSPAGCIFASLQIDTAKVPSYVPIFYDCNSAEDNNQRKYNHLRYLMARLVKDNSDIQESNPYTNWAMIYRFLKELTLHFVAKSSHAPKSQRYMERATNLISYIDAHYQEGLSLKKVAEDAGLSVPYLSSFFEKYLGTNFLSYYTEVRLSHAYTALMSTDKTIESILLHLLLENDYHY